RSVSAKVDISRKCAEAPASAVCDLHGLLESDAELARQIDPRLDAEHHCSAEFGVLPITDPRRLMNGKPEAVPGAMDEILPEAGALDHAADGAIQLVAGDAGRRELERRLDGL